MELFTELYPNWEGDDDVDRDGDGDLDGDGEYRVGYLGGIFGWGTDPGAAAQVALASGPTEVVIEALRDVGGRLVPDRVGPGTVPCIKLSPQS